MVTRRVSSLASVALVLANVGASSDAALSAFAQPAPRGLAKTGAGNTAQRPALAVHRRSRAAGLSAATAELSAATPAPAGVGVMPTTLNLAKNIVGSGVLALAAGVGAFSSAKVAVLPALALLLFLGGVSGYTFSLIARLGSEVGADSYREIWVKIFGERLQLIPALTVAFKTYVGGLAYSIILGDSFAGIAKLAGAPATLCTSNVWIVLISALVLLPLSLMRDLSSLAIGSLIGTGGTLYTALFMVKRLLDGSYAAGGRFHEAAIAKPAFAAAATAASPLLNTRIFVLVSMLATTFLAHYNAPKYFAELAPPADGSSKQAAFTKVCVGAFGLAALLCGTIMAAGYLTFGAASQGLILNNYATSDTLAFLARIGIAGSIIFSYPLNFVGLRENVLGMLKLDKAKSSVHVVSSLVLLMLMNGLALFLKDLGLVVSFGGAILGSSLVYVFPALMFIQATRQKAAALAKEGKSLPKGRKLEMVANFGLVGLGAFLAAVGGVMSLKSAGH